MASVPHGSTLLTSERFLPALPQSFGTGGDRGDATYFSWTNVLDIF